MLINISIQKTILKISIKKVQKANEWLMYCDTLNKQLREKQDFYLQNYQRYLPVMFYSLFNTSAAPKAKSLKYPHSSFEVWFIMKKF